MTEVQIGIVGGSGLYEMASLTDVKEMNLSTPFGDPSDNYIVGTLAGRRVAFLARHGRGHRLMPSELNYRANIYGFKLLGVKRLISASAVGSLRQEMAPLDVVLPDQFVDRTHRRISSFFGDGVVAHISLAEPVCPELHKLAGEQADGLGRKIHHRGTYLNMEGPQFSTRAESNLFRRWGMDIIGMTNMAEARLAREAEICYLTVALVTDYDCWHESEEAVTVEMLISYLRQNATFAQQLIERLVQNLPEKRGCACGQALENAIITNPESIEQSVKQRLQPIIGKYIN